MPQLTVTLLISDAEAQDVCRSQGLDPDRISEDQARATVSVVALQGAVRALDDAAARGVLQRKPVRVS